MAPAASAGNAARAYPEPEFQAPETADPLPSAPEPVADGEKADTARDATQSESAKIMHFAPLGARPSSSAAEAAADLRAQSYLPDEMARAPDAASPLAAPAKTAAPAAVPPIPSDKATAKRLKAPAIKLPDAGKAMALGKGLSASAVDSLKSRASSAAATSGGLLAGLKARLQSDKSESATQDQAPASVAAITAKAPSAPPATAPEAPTATPKARLGALSLRRKTPANVDAEAERKRLTPFVERDIDVGGKPRHLGIILTVILLLFMAGVAAWASIFLDDGLARFFRSEPETVQTAALPDTPEIASPEALALPEAGDLAPEETADVAALPADDPVIAPSAVDEAVLAALAPPSEEEALARYAASGIWQAGPDAPAAPSAEETVPLTLAALDDNGFSTSSIALPAPSDALSQPLVPQGEDAPAEPSRLVEATPEGVLSVDGVTIYAGLPDVVPPRMPNDATLPERPAAPEGAEVAEETAPARPVDPLAQIRPRARPGSDAEAVEEAARRVENAETQAEEEEDLAYAAIRPQTRPEDLVPEATVGLPEEARPEAFENAPRPQARPEDLVAEPEPTPEPEPAPEPEPEPEVAAAPEPQPDPLAGGTPQAVKTSIVPRDRPRNFSTIVRRTEEAETEQATRVAAIAPRTVSPAGPTTNTVARAATDKNAINLRQINLIGVYGKPDSRRALVRLANGRYMKVKVGDRLDGGKVAAIGDGELRYVKGSRSVILKMPSG